MERIRALIDKLHQQAEQQADASTLMVTVQILQEELTRYTATPTNYISTSKVAVTLPAGKFSFPKETEREPVKALRSQPQQAAPVRQPVTEPMREAVKAPVKEAVTAANREPVREIKKEYAPEPVKPVVVARPVKEAVPEKEHVNETALPPVKDTPAVNNPAPVAEKVKTIPAAAGIPSLPPGDQEQAGSWLYDPVHDIPTLSHQKAFKEMNDVYGQYETSLNDKLKSEKTELAAVLKEGPIRDLKKAIGVNDRFVFLGELFRGDEAMYERSIKTINNFRIYPEAEYWIERELKVKLGWDENKEVVKHFRQLVRRRFM